MIYNVHNTELQRDRIIEKIKEYHTIIDIGGSLGFWTDGLVTHVADLQKPLNSKGKQSFIVDICDPLTWNEMLNYISINGRFDYAICTQTLEHSTNINSALFFLQIIAREGFVSVPSKYTELKRGVAFSDEGLSRCNITKHFRGFLPHKWIFTIKNNVLWAFPKLNFVESMKLDWVDTWEHDVELSFEWNETIPNYIIDDTFLDYPDPQKAIEFYYNNLEEGL